MAGIQLSRVECGLSEADKERFLDCERVTDPMRRFVNIIPELVAPGLPRGKYGISSPAFGRIKSPGGENRSRPGRADASADTQKSLIAAGKANTLSMTAFIKQCGSIS
jgi:hypothetical protein